ncbi:cyclin-dependent kinase C-1-like isoform X2 [Salvia splendens]|uniref:cyclin-dependent kinase C-1-like isoform X2 n=1 Tax=Salvia splendens TaxID=180675 RepID=UPI001C27F64D|nr:cyclin-dependent kinase C-1-like isoform X2 [Salvia splendens]
MAATNQLNVEERPSWGSRSVECFEKLEQIGEGTYGQVYMAREKRTGEIVALKKIRMDNEKEGFPITAIREIKILKKLQHENVIQLKEIVTSPGRETNEQVQPDAENNKYKGSIYMVFEYMDHDLTGLADRPGLRFTVPQIKCYMKQLLTGLHYCHVNQVLHRDIKGSNLLIDNEGNLKLADFGLARSFSNDINANLTNRVITLWYRPPELLLGATKYGPAVDMWSVGCIFAELLYGKPILPGKNEPEQLNKIFELCGTPDELIWPGVSKIPWYNKFKPTRPMKKRIRELFRHFDRHALDLLEKMLVLDPAQRISAKDALDSEYFWNDPLPCDPKSLPKYESSHEFQTKKKRQQQRQNEEIAKRQKLQHPQQHARLPPIQQSGQSHQQHWNGPGHQMNNNSQMAMSGAPSHHQYGKPRGPPAGPSRYPPGGAGGGGGGYYQDRGGQSGGYSSAPFPSQGRGPPPYPGNTAPSNGPRGAAGGYGAPPNYSQSGQYNGRGQNPMGGNRNQQYGWQQ